MRDQKTIQLHLEQLRGQFLQWGTPDLQVFGITKDELRAWIRALEWVLLRARTSANPIPKLGEVLRPVGIISAQGAQGNQQREDASSP